MLVIAAIAVKMIREAILAILAWALDASYPVDRRVIALQMEPEQATGPNQTT